jgi:hypothetical protein
MHPSRRTYLEIGALLCFLAFPCKYGGGLGGSAFAFQVETDPQSRIPMLDEGKGLIHLDLSVTNAEGEPVSGLDREDFELLDEGHPRKSLTFHAFDSESAKPNYPTQLVLFLDTLGLKFEKVSRMRIAITQFLRQNNGHLALPVSIFGFSDEGLWTVPDHDSNDGNALASDLAERKRIALMHRPDALRALSMIAAGQRRKFGHKALLWIGPGCGPMTDVPSPDGAGGPFTTGIFPPRGAVGEKSFELIYWFNLLFREARLTIDEIPADQDGPCSNGYEQFLGGVRTVREADQRFLYKKVLAIESGGTIEDGRDLVGALNRCARRLRSVYTLSFDPPAALEPHEYHALEVRVKNPGLSARTNTGYYDEPFYVDHANPNLRQVTVEQLGQLLQGTSAQQIAARLRGADDVFNSSQPGFSGPGRPERFDLSRIELTERVSLSKLTDWLARHKNRSLQDSLIAVADESAFLEPPSTEVPNRPAPDDAAQRHILSAARDYLDTAVPRLSDFYATRTTVRYQDETEVKGANNVVGYKPLHVTQVSKARVLYRHGKEVVESKGGEPDDLGQHYLVTHGTFGPLFAEMRRAVETPGQMKWVRWENSSQGDRAVFQFEVPAAQSEFFEGGCCLPDAEGTNSFRIQAGYREEVAIDPENGRILRVQQQFDLEEYVPEDVDEVMIDYGPVKIGGMTYICPVRSVGLARSRTAIKVSGQDQSFGTWGPYSTKINDMRFSDYHVFRSESRILPGFTPEE